MRSHKVLYIPYGGKEIPHSNYEVLVSDIPDKLKWLPDANGKLYLPHAIYRDFFHL